MKFMYAYGKFKIVWNNDSKMWDLFAGDMCCGSYAEAESAASDVFTHTTGDDGWDDMMDSVHPTDLSEWLHL